MIAVGSHWVMSPRSTGIGGDCKRGLPYGGGADLCSLADVGLFLLRFVHYEAGVW